MAFCEKCGAQLADGAKFCEACGNATTSNNTTYTYAPNPDPAPNASNWEAAPTVKLSTWDGGVLETVIASIVASVLCSITCGIATPWAVCYLMRFVISHAVIDGKRMTFDGTGGQLFGNWIKWLLLTIITCGIYSFWVVPRLIKWVVSHIHAQN